ncbi:MAG: hypothetical protein HC838_10165 [Spirulinaceae cyanobacterium RM2_2_10]|nr:hypothetical protein [Spirulinaceae cyanobacterium SM2_1_0]NJO20326.1 hypothetical protein [Spirulinaceae cyanobacterium RM2_2_10]
MLQPFILAPRYRLDDASPWLVGIDPGCRYWLSVNGVEEQRVSIPGLLLTDLDDWKQAVRNFRALQPSESMDLTRPSAALTLHCISENCYAIAHHINGAPVWHLFDRETVDSLLMTSHPDWQCAACDLDLSRELLAQSFCQPAAVA